MTSIAITLPDSLNDFLEELASQEGFDNVGDLLQSFIRELQKFRAKKDLDHKIREGIRSPKVPMTQKRWLALERELFGKA